MLAQDEKETTGLAIMQQLAKCLWKASEQTRESSRCTVEARGGAGGGGSADNLPSKIKPPTSSCS